MQHSIILVWPMFSVRRIRLKKKSHSISSKKAMVESFGSAMIALGIFYYCAM